MPLMALTATATKEVSSALQMLTGLPAYGIADQGSECFTFSGPSAWAKLRPDGAKTSRE